MNAQRGESFCETIVEREGSRRRSPGFLRDVARVEGAVAERPEERVCVGDPSVGLRVVRVGGEGLVEAFDGLAESLFRPLVPVIAALQIETMSVRVVGAASGEERALGLGQPVHDG
jgi:hypothetical protein